MDAEVAQQIAELRTLANEALEVARHHGLEHHLLGTDPAAPLIFGAGAPTTQAEKGTLYWDTTNSDLYVNSDGGTTWTAIGGGSKNPHTLADAQHTDVIMSSVQRGDTIRRGLPGGAEAWENVAIGAADTYWGSDGTDPSWRAVPFVLYIPLGDDRLGQLHAPT